MMCFICKLLGKLNILTPLHHIFVAISVPYIYILRILWLVKDRSVPGRFLHFLKGKGKMDLDWFVYISFLHRDICNA